jgi:hypothetical protein
MSHRSWNPRLAVVALMAIIVFLACPGTSSSIVFKVPASALEDCSNGKCLIYATWGKKIDNAINGQVVGYAYRVVREGTLGLPQQLGVVPSPEQFG